MKTLPCPFCGSRPHHGLGKVEYDQLHGDPYQRWHIKCPRGHAQVWGMTKELAVRDWNTRRGEPTPNDLHYAHEIIKRHCDSLKSALERIANGDPTQVYSPLGSLHAAGMLSQWEIDAKIAREALGTVPSPRTALENDSGN